MEARQKKQGTLSEKYKKKVTPQRYLPTESLFFYLQHIYLIEVATVGKQSTHTTAQDLKYKNSIAMKITELTSSKSSQDSTRAEKELIEIYQMEPAQGNLICVRNRVNNRKTHSHTHTQKILNPAA
jgi:hypothetical protein